MRQEKAMFLALLATALLVISYLFVSNESLRPTNKTRKITRFLSHVVGYGRDLIPQTNIVVCNTLPVVNKTNVASWQHCPKAAVYLYSAFLDIRYKYQGKFFPQVRVLGLSKGKSKQDLYCLLWNGNISYSVSAKCTEIWIKNWDDPSDDMYYRPYIFTCPLPHKVKTVEAVSIISSPCEQPAVYLPVKHSSQSEKNDFAICVKGMNYKNDISLRLIEWIELHLLLGVDVISVYVYSVHPNVVKVLNYYQNRGIVKITFFNQPRINSSTSQSTKENVWQKRRYELIPYNDCFYQHIYTHRFVVLLDLDEVIVPTQYYTWQEMVASILGEIPNALEIYCSISAQNVYFFDEFGSDNNHSIPNYMHILKHVYRSANFSKLGYAVKSFSSTNNTLAVFNHYALIPLYPKLRRNGLISRSAAQLHHYRSECPQMMGIECEKNFLRYRKRDTLVWKYATNLISKVQNAIHKLNRHNMAKIIKNI